MSRADTFQTVTEDAAAGRAGPAGRSEGPLLTFESLDLQSEGVPELRGFSLTIGQGEIVGIITGDERSARRVTRVALGLERPDAGEVILLGHRLSTLRERERLALRREVGMMFHNSGLIHNLTVRVNVALPALYHGKFHYEGGTRERVERLLQRCEIAHLADLRPAALDETDRKRVALARAWALQPRLILLEDPLVDIDGITGSQLMDMILGPGPPDWEGRDPRPEGTAMLFTAQGFHESFFRYLRRLIVLNDGIPVFDGDPREYDRRGNRTTKDFGARPGGTSV